MALVESGEGRDRLGVDELLLYCFHYDPDDRPLRRSWS